MAKTKGNCKKNNSGDVCMTCDAPCCRDITMLITKPRTKTEINELTQYLHFDTSKVFIRNKKWYLTIDGKCIYLSRNNLCKKYSKRPARCRRHNPPDCERFADYYDVLISTPEEFEDYINGMALKKRRTSSVGRRP